MLVLKGTEFGQEISQDFSVMELGLAVAIGQSWLRQGLKPRLMVKTYDGQFNFLNDLLQQRKAA